MPDAFDPYRKWLGIPAAEQPANHYRLLGTALFEDDPDVIESAADQRMAHVRAFQTGAHSAASQRILNELAAARLCLLNPASRERYANELRCRLAPAPEFAERPMPRVSQARGRRLRPAVHAWLLLAVVAIPAALFVGYLISTKGGQAVAMAQPQEPVPAQPDSPPAEGNRPTAQKPRVPAHEAPQLVQPAPAKRAPPPEPVKDADTTEPAKEAPRPAPPPATSSDPSSGTGSSDSPPHAAEVVHSDPASNQNGTAGTAVATGARSGSEDATNTGNSKRFEFSIPDPQRGKWSIEGDELVQSSPGSGSAIVFGQANWREFDFLVEVLRVSPNDGCGMLLSYQNDQNKCGVGFGGWQNTAHNASVWQGGQMRDLAYAKGSFSTGEWHRLEIRMRGNDGKCFLDGAQIMTLDLKRPSKGRVGLFTNGAYRFRNILVKSPGGDVLLEGLPALDAGPAQKPHDAGTQSTTTTGKAGPAAPEKAGAGKLVATEAFSLKRHEAAVTRLAFHRTRPLLASAGKDGRVLLWDLQTRAPLELHKFAEEVWAVKFHPGGDYLAYANRTWWGSRLFFKTLAGLTLNEIKDFKNPGGEVTSIAYSHEGRLLAAGQANGTIRLWDAAQSKEILPPVAFGDGHSIYALAFGTAAVDRKSKRTEYRLAAGGQDGVVRILTATVDNTNGEWTFQAGNVQFPMGAAVLGVRFNPKGNLLGCTHVGGRVSLCDPSTGKLIRDLAQGGGSAEWVAFHPQRSWCITAHKKEQVARIWNTETAELLHELTGHTAGVMCAEFSPDGRHVATASEDLSIKLWNLAGAGVPAALDRRKKPKPTLPIVGD